MKIACLFLFSFCWAASAFAGRPVRGVYTVPVAQELSAYNSYPVEFKSENYEQKPNEMNFPLPTTLVGENILIEIKQDPNDPAHWSGPKADGLCKKVDRFFQCQLKFNDLAIDPVKVQAKIEEQFQNQIEKAGRLKVAQQFGGEPVGIITYKLRGRERGTKF